MDKQLTLITRKENFAFLNDELNGELKDEMDTFLSELVKIIGQVGTDKKQNLSQLLTNRTSKIDNILRKFIN